MAPVSSPQLAQFGGGGRVQFRAMGRRHGGKRFFLPLVQAFGVNVQGAGGGLGRAAFTGQAKGLGPEGGVIAPTFAGWGTVFQDIGKIRPYSVQIYSTISILLR